MENTLPKAVICDECGAEARVRACGRVEYDWPKTPVDGQLATIPTIRWARLTVDCPHCGVKSQDVRIGSLQSAGSGHSQSIGRTLRNPPAAVRFGKKK
jgi:hypothetical protein